jgi:hypothetical protein
METMTFTKLRAAQLALAMQQDQPLTVPADGWTVDELLHLAGAAITCATARLDSVMPEYVLMPLEHKEHHLKGRYDDLFTAVEFFADMTTLAYQDRYDHRFGPVVVASLVRDGDDRAIRIDSGSNTAAP